MTPDAERRPGSSPAVARNAHSSGYSTTNTTPRCPLACGSGPACPWRCPTSLDAALDELLADLVAVAT